MSMAAVNAENSEVPPCKRARTDACVITCEVDVGIMEYLSSHEGLSGIIKQRYSDFIVNEISLDGEILQLTDVSPPKPPELPVKELTADLQNAICDDDKKRLTDLMNGTEGTAVDIKVDDDKSRRTAVHLAIRILFPKLSSSTVEKGDEKFINVSKNKKCGRSEWPKELGNYCHFLLYKENTDTMQAVSRLAQLLHLNPGIIHYAGNKDKRAKTVQKLSIYRVRPERLHGLNKILKSMTIGNISFEKDALRLGDLSGNHFTVVLRNFSGKYDQTSSAIKSLQDVGFINYFGMQRFGTSAIPTHHIGRALLHSNWSEAVDLILKERGDTGEKNELAACRKKWSSSQDAAASLTKLGGYVCVERHLLNGLIKHGKDNLLHAINMIPRNTKTMYVHSYQSYVWNMISSRRIQKYKQQLIVGDLVIPNTTSKRFESPVVVSDENITHYSIYDIVLPLPGFEVLYPDNEVKKWYEEIFMKDDLDLSNLKHKVKDFSLSGSYRHLYVKPKDLSWKLFSYDDVLLPLVISDYERLTGASEPVSVEDGKYQALKIEFSLPSSTYATMAIRELLRNDTSSAHQTSLNVT